LLSVRDLGFFDLSLKRGNMVQPPSIKMVHKGVFIVVI
jgi:hypothetical protein